MINGSIGKTLKLFRDINEATSGFMELLKHRS